MTARQTKILPSVLFAAVFLILLQPSLYRASQNLGLSPISNSYAEVLSLLVSIPCIVTFLVRGKKDSFYYLSLLFFGWIAASTIINQGDLLVWGTTWLPLFGTLGLVGALWKDLSREMLIGMLTACSFYLFANFAFILWKGDFSIGAQTYLIFGVRTVTFRIAIPAIACSLLLDNMNEKRVGLRSVFLYALSIFEVLIGYCATALCVLLFFGLLFCLIQSTRVRRLLNSFTYIAADIALFVGIILLRIQTAFGWLIEGVLHKGLGLSGRVEVWDAALSLLSNQHLLVGYGASYLWTTIYAHGRWMMHAHNDFLNLAMTGGIPLVVLMLALEVLAALRLFKNRTSFASALVAGSLFSFMLIGVFEVTNCVGFFFLLAIAYYAFPPSGEQPKKRGRHARVESAPSALC
ncbi:MAG: hypothetical protein UCH28_09795 [Adlercreutzia sp.]|nr:hypothetical protein [Adlercreutzia sp.]